MARSEAQKRADKKYEKKPCGACEQQVAGSVALNRKGSLEGSPFLPATLL